MNIEINSLFYIHDLDTFKHRIARSLPYMGLLKGEELVYEGTTKHWRHKVPVQFKVSASTTEVKKPKRTLLERFSKLQLKAKTVSQEEEPLIQAQIRAITGLFNAREMDVVNLLDQLDDLESSIIGEGESKPTEIVLPVKKQAKKSSPKISFSPLVETFRREKLNAVFNYLLKIGELEEPLVIPSSETNFDEYEEKLEFDFALVFERLKHDFKLKSSKNLNLLSHNVAKKDFLSFCHVLVKEAQK